MHLKTEAFVKRKEGASSFLPKMRIWFTIGKIKITFVRFTTSENFRFGEKNQRFKKEEVKKRQT